MHRHLIGYCSTCVRETHWHVMVINVGFSADVCGIITHQQMQDPHTLQDLETISAMDFIMLYTENTSVNHTSSLFNNITLLPYYQHSLAVATVFILAYGLIFSLCMLGNLLVCFIVLKNRQMRTVTNIFILNLAISDLLVGILCLPITLVDNLITGWPFDVVICKMSGLVQGASVSASVFTLVAIAVERFRCIVYPFQRKLTQRQAIVSIAFIWALAVAIMCPSAVTLTVSQDVLHFMVDRDNITYPLFMRKIYTTVLFSHIYLAPVTLIGIMYTRIAIKLVKSPASIRNARAEDENRRVFRRKLRVVNMLLMVALLFTVSWLPLWILMMLTDYGNLSPAHLDMVAVYIFPFAHWLAFFNSSVNPVVYGYFNENFRRGFQAAFRMGVCVVKEPRHNGTWKHNRVFADGDAADAQGNVRRDFCTREQRDELVLEDLD